MPTLGARPESLSPPRAAGQGRTAQHTRRLAGRAGLGLGCSLLPGRLPRCCGHPPLPGASLVEKPVLLWQRVNSMLK